MTEEAEQPTASDTAPAAFLPAFRALSPGMFYLLVALVFGADQISKAWIQGRLNFRDSMPVFGYAFALTLTHNTGGAWGLLPQGNVLFIGFAGIAVIALLLAYHRMHRVELFVGSAFALALGGALGNLLDRIRYGYVVDFFDARFLNFPVFNVADSAISLGIVLLFIHFIRSSRLEAMTAPDATANGEP